MGAPKVSAEFAANTSSFTGHVKPSRPVDANAVVVVAVVAMPFGAAENGVGNCCTILTGG